MSSTPQNRLRNVPVLPISPVVDEATHGGSKQQSENAAGMSSGEAQKQRSDKLDAIRKAIASGAYDSDEILEQALGRIIESIEADDDA